MKGCVIVKCKFTDHITPITLFSLLFITVCDHFIFYNLFFHCLGSFKVDELHCSALVWAQSSFSNFISTTVPQPIRCCNLTSSSNDRWALSVQWESFYLQGTSLVFRLLIVLHSMVSLMSWPGMRSSPTSLWSILLPTCSRYSSRHLQSSGN